MSTERSLLRRNIFRLKNDGNNSTVNDIIAIENEDYQTQRRLLAATMIHDIEGVKELFIAKNANCSRYYYN